MPRAIPIAIAMGALLAALQNGCWALGVAEVPDEYMLHLRSLTLPLLVVAWVFQDSKSTGYWPAFHYGLGLTFLWPVLVPHYVVRTRGLRGWPVALGLYAALLAPTLGWLVGVLLFPWVWS